VAAPASKTLGAAAANHRGENIWGHGKQAASKARIQSQSHGVLETTHKTQPSSRFFPIV